MEVDGYRRASLIRRMRMLLTRAHSAATFCHHVCPSNLKLLDRARDLVRASVRFVRELAAEISMHPDEVDRRLNSYDFGEPPEETPDVTEGGIEGGEG